MSFELFVHIYCNFGKSKHLIMRTLFFAFITLIFSVPAFAQSQTIVINEFMADNASVITDETGEYEDWIEIYNFGDEPVDIGGWFFTDDFDEPKAFRIRQGNDSTIVPPKSHLLLWADDDWEQGILHLEFKLSRKGEQIAIYDMDGETLIDSVSFKLQLPDHSRGRKSDNASEWVDFKMPTPGTSNRE